ncbi:mannose-1-phosphate guanylyltransferase [candidate division KSB1 bacterium]|nr:mannose-1-phosphate guanylyltransferase [candidate division KSB1 bacterium]
MYCVIMAGGSGTRFWPRSRDKNPKQFLNISGKRSLLKSTLDRFHQFIGWDHMFIAAREGHQEVMETQRFKVPDSNILYEPVGKNTAPCVGLAALQVQKRDKEGTLIVTPADHLIRKQDQFKRTILLGHKIAKEKRGLVTIGIQPNRPATGYGYIQVAEAVKMEAAVEAYKVKTFAEKPNLETAKRFLESGDFLWNSGIFIFRVDVFFDTIEEYLPDLYDGLMEIKKYIDRPNYSEVLNRVYHQIKSVSLDYGIMEKSNNVYTVRGKFYWNDLGSWEQVYDISNKDKNKNVVSGDAILVDVNDSYITASKGLVAVLGLDNIVVVQEGGITLVCSRDRVEDVKMVVNQIKHKKLNKFL